MAVLNINIDSKYAISIQNKNPLQKEGGIDNKL